MKIVWKYPEPEQDCCFFPVMRLLPQQAGLSFLQGHGRMDSTQISIPNKRDWVLLLLLLLCTKACVFLETFSFKITLGSTEK